MGKEGGEGTEIKLSYVLPTYNRVEYLGECLLSLIEQKFPKDKYEIIIIDDGSTDSTHELVDFFCEENKNIRYYLIPKKGVEYARNLGNKYAKGKIIGVCDSDDIYHPLRTKITVDYFETHPDVDIMNGSYSEINHQGLLVRKYKAKVFNKKEFYGGVGYFCHDNCAYWKEKILITPYRESDNSSTDDWKLVEDWMSKGYKFGYTKKELCMVRTLRNGIMGARREKAGVRLSYA